MPWSRGRLERRLAAGAKVPYRPFQHFGVEGVANRLDLPALVGAQQLARPPDLEVVHGEAEADPEVAQGLDRFEPLHRVRGYRPAIRGEEVGVGPVVGATDPSAELVELGEPEAVRAIDDDGVGGRHVDPGLDDGRAHEDVEAPVVEVEHDLLEVAFAHLPVRDPDLRLRHDGLDLLGELLDVLHPIVHEIDLTAAPDLAQDRFADDLRAPLPHDRSDREASLRCGGDERQIAERRQGHVQGTGDRGSR